VQIVKDMEPALRGLVLGSERPEPTWEEWARAFDAENAVPVGEPPKVSPLPIDKAAVPPATKPEPAPAKPGPVAKPGAAVSPTAKPKILPAPAKPVVPAKPAAAVEEPPPAPPPPQMDKPDPPPPPPAPPPKPAPSHAKEKRFGPWSAPEGEGWDFLR
jgi:hypothetical protein